MNAQLPTISVESIPGLNAWEKSIVSRIVNPKTGQLRASKPKVTRTEGGKDEYGQRIYIKNYDEGCAAYVWRMVAFYVSPVSQHKCMPVMAFCDLPSGENGYREVEKSLESLIDAIVASVPSRQRHGLQTWARALGQTV